MSREPENFDTLIRLLALKRHEQPPPGYFNRFRLQVLARIERGEGESRGFSLQAWFDQVPGFGRIWSALDARPALAGAFGLALGALFLGGAIYSEGPDASALSPFPVMAAETGYAPVREPLTIADAPGVPATLRTVSHAGLAVGGELLGAPHQTSLFQQYRQESPFRSSPAATGLR